MINVWGDSVVCGIVAHLSKAEIAESEKREQDEQNKLKGETNEAFEMEKPKHNADHEVDAKF